MMTINGEVWFGQTKTINVRIKTLFFTVYTGFYTFCTLQKQATEKYCLFAACIGSIDIAVRTNE